MKRLLLLSFILTGLFNQVFAQNSPSVLLVATESVTYRDDVANKLFATGSFSVVDIFDAEIATPSVSELQNYDAVLVWSDLDFFEADVLGDNLATFIEEGGHVITMVYTAGQFTPIEGAFASNYRLIDAGNNTFGAATLGTINVPIHPLVNNITSFSGGTSSPRSDGAVINGEVIAEWSDGFPLIVAQENVGPASARRVDLNFWPVSSDVAGTSGWDATTQGTQIIENAIIWITDPFRKVLIGEIANDIGQSYDVAWADYDNDGFQDLFVPERSGADKLYHNNGDGTFSAIIAGDLGADADASFGATWGDYDNDGDPDLFVAVGGFTNSNSNRLYQNNGDGTFTSITAGDLGLDGIGALSSAWADYNNDGFLDLAVGNYNTVPSLYQNNGDGTFTFEPNFTPLDAVNSWSVDWGDFNGDNQPDLYFSNYGTANLLYRNEGNGFFTKITTGPHVTDINNNYSASWIDYDNDGDQDIFVPVNGGDNKLYINDGAGNFSSDLTNIIVTEPGNSWSASWGDFNNDGREDLYIGNEFDAGSLFRNNGAGSFTKINSTIVSKDRVINGSGTLASAWTDVDNDGDLDLFTSNFGGENHFYTNEINNENNWIDIRLTGTMSNLSGIGAQVKVTRNNGSISTQIASTQNGRGQAGQNIHFGLGSGSARDISVIWPSGLAQSVKASNNQVITIVEGETTDNRPKIMLLAAEGNILWFNDVRDKLLNTGEFSSITSYKANNGTPSLSVLEEHDAVFVWSQNGFENNDAIGDILADYIDAGGPVVSAVFATASIPIGGRFATDFQLLVPGGQSSGVQLTLGTILQPDHPTMNRVFSFDGGTASFKSTSTTITSGSEVVAEWSDASPLIVIKEGVGNSNAKRVDLNFWPTSSDAFSGNWVSSTNGATIIANALLWTLSAPDQFTKLSSSILSADLSNSWSNAWGDYNDDGNLDLFVGNQFTTDLLFQNNGNGTFTKNTTDASVILDKNSVAATWGDYDNDGHLDLFVPNDGGPNILYRNNGSGQLIEAKNFGDSDFSVGAAWGDYDGDGFLDLFVGNGGNNRLYKNDQNGDFIEIIDGTITDSNPYSYGVSWADYDDDGFLDLYIAEFGGSNILLHNNGDETFTRITGEIIEDISSLGASWADYDNDADLDLFVSNYSSQNNSLFQNNGDGTFTKVLNQSIVLDGSSSLGAAWEDFNNDSYLDLFVATEGTNNNLLYQNNGNGTFESIRLWSPTNDPKATFGASWADYDRDGDVDLFATAISAGEPNLFYENNGNSNNWINIVLEGVESNKSAIGAKIYITTENGETQFREVSAQTGFGSQNSLNVEFGLGTETLITQIEINWPSGRDQLLLDVSSNQFITIVEDLEPPVDFQVGNVVSVGGTVVDGEWNASNTSVEITIPIDNDQSLNGGTVQILASVNGEAEQDLGLPVSILGANLGGNQIVSITKEELETLVGFGPTAVLSFNASMTDVSGNGPTFGTQSSSTLTVLEIIIESENFPAFYDVNGGTLEASITLNSASDNRTVVIEYNGITEPETNILTTNATTEDNITYRFNLGQQITGLSEPLGISYTFRVTEGGQTLFSSLGVTHIQVLGDNSYTIPSLKFGSNVSDYQIVAIPFELANKNVSAVFEDDLGAYDDSKWRLFHYQGGNNVEKKSGSINPDEGYWLISSATASIDVGAGSVPQATKTNPYQISLSSGWNQIGNPYLFNLSWSEILAYNGNPPGIDTQLTLFNGGFQSGDILRAYRGAFVNSSASITLDIPVIRNKSIQGRKGGDRNRTETIDSDNWIVDIDLKADDLVYQLSGFGMNSDAQLEKDMNDLYTVPRFIEYLEINFQRDEYINSPLTMDVVPTAENFEWNFTVNSNLEGQELALQWDNSYWGDSEKQLLLFDEVTRKTINMREQTEYKYNYSAARNFKVLFGDQKYVESNLAPKIVSIDNAYPNPFGDKIFIPIGLPEHSSEYNVTLEIYDQMGRKINDRVLSNTSYGYQNIEWDATDYQGNKVSKGIYFVHLLIQNEEKSENFIQRIIYK